MPHRKVLELAPDLITSLQIEIRSLKTHRVQIRADAAAFDALLLRQGQETCAQTLPRSLSLTQTVLMWSHFQNVSPNRPARIVPVSSRRKMARGAKLSGPAMAALCWWRRFRTKSQSSGAGLCSTEICIGLLTVASSRSLSPAGKQDNRTPAIFPALFPNQLS